MQFLEPLNITFFHTLNSLVGTSPFLDSIIVFFAEPFTYVLIAIVCLAVYRDIWKERVQEFLWNVAGLIISILSAYVLTGFFRLFYDHPRPLWALDTPHLLIETTSSFPSAHTTFLFSVATSIYFFGNKKLAYFLYASGLVVGVARVVAGVHFPLDIIGGIVLGIAVGYLVRYLLHRYANVTM